VYEIQISFACFSRNGEREWGNKSMLGVVDAFGWKKEVL
jgi:hypothetical protein